MMVTHIPITLLWQSISNSDFLSEMGNGFCLFPRNRNKRKASTRSPTTSTELIYWQPNRNIECYAAKYYLCCSTFLTSDTLNISSEIPRIIKTTPAPGRSLHIRGLKTIQITEDPVTAAGESRPSLTSGRQSDDEIPLSRISWRSQAGLTPVHIACIFLMESSWARCNQKFPPQYLIFITHIF